jgi:hypothetical protein
MLTFVIVVFALSALAAKEAHKTWERRRYYLALKRFEESMFAFSKED